MDANALITEVSAVVAAVVGAVKLPDAFPKTLAALADRRGRCASRAEKLHRLEFAARWHAWHDTVNAEDRKAELARFIHWAGSATATDAPYTHYGDVDTAYRSYVDWLDCKHNGTGRFPPLVR